MKKLLCFIIFISIHISAQENKGVFVDEDGLMKWRSDSSEVSLFGVNYSTPFAHSYRAIKLLGLSHEDAIDIDVAHMARLGFNAYRVHMWDKEISDSAGNLLENEHLRLFDYLLMTLKERDFTIILTPIAWWGTGWPEPDPEVPGFAKNYSKVEMVTNDTARAAQRNYLKQIINHKNYYTGISYKDDPDIIAFEIINEPHHPRDTVQTTMYVNEMADVLREKGLTKPIFYNISENWSDTQAPAVYNADIDGISFQWYPAGLVKRSALKGNFLGHVNKYPIPDSGDRNLHNKSRMVYEFDAADVAQPIMYPAMARSFREAGMQFAAMFSYDPAYIAGSNTEYNTHFLNLLYTPKKAVSLMIAAEVFRNVEAYREFGAYPENLRFGDFTIDYASQLSQYNSPEKFYYSNDTESNPVSPQQLNQIAGAGSSPLVSYDGCGSYFLDRLNDATWRLELMPDAAWTGNPFGRNSPDKDVARLYFNSSKMKFNLPGLTGNLYLFSQSGEELLIFNSANEISVEPGVYLISSKRDINSLTDGQNLHTPAMDNLPAELRSESEITVVHLEPVHIYAAGQSSLRFAAYSNGDIGSAAVFLRKPGWRDFIEVTASKTGKYSYEADFDAERMGEGVIEYCIYIETPNGIITYPSLVKKHPGSWDYYAEDFYTLNIIPENSDLLLLSPDTDMSSLSYPNVWRFVSFDINKIYNMEGTPEFNIRFNSVRRELDEFVFQVEFEDDFRSTLISEYKFIIIELGSGTQGLNKLSLNLVDTDLFSYKTEINTNSGSKFTIPLSSFSESNFVLLPRPYPRFLPYSFQRDDSRNIGESSGINFLQVAIDMSHLIKGDAGAVLNIKKVSLSK